MIQIDINMPIGCIYEGDNGKTEYCPLCNHDDVPFCQYIENEPEIAIGIDERPVYCPLSDVPESCQDTVSRQAAIEVIDAVFPVDPMKSEYAQGIACGAALAKTYVEQMPSAQSNNDHIWEALSRVYNMDGVPDEAKSIVGDVMLELDKPSEQPEIVRCKNCVYFPEGTGEDHDLEFPEEFKCPCECEDYWYSWKPADDWFCANGKRKE